jgi:hypothetical protein
MMFRAVEATKAPTDWDTAYRMYLTLGVLETVRYAKTNVERPAVTDGLRAVEGLLGLPGHPKEATYDPFATRRALEKLTTELRNGWAK